MIMKKVSLLIKAICCFAAMWAAAPLSAQDGGMGLWSSIGLEKDLPKGMNAGIEAEYRLRDGLSATDRWSIGASLSKRLYRNAAKTFNVRAELGYKFINAVRPEETKFKSDGFSIEDVLYDYNILSEYWQNRHRLSATLSASYELGRFKFSVKERYQYTYESESECDREKHRFELDEEKLENQGIVEAREMPVEKDIKTNAADSKQVLRSRLQASYNIPHWKYDPFVSYELFNGLDSGFDLRKMRVNAGVDFSFNKKHYFKLSYLWQDNSDDDEPAGAAVCIGYTFSF